MRGHVGTRAWLAVAIVGVCLLAISSAARAEPPTLDWARSIQSTNSVRCQDLAVDAAGGVYAVGVFTGTVDFDPGPGSHELIGSGSSLSGFAAITGGKAFVLKLDAEGAFEWVRVVDCGRGSSVGQSIALAPDGGVIAVGGFSGRAVITDDDQEVELLSEQGLYHAGDTFAVKFSAEGRIEWASMLGGVLNKSPTGLAVDAKGNSVIVGTFRETPSYGHRPDALGLRGEGTYLARLNGRGERVWEQGFERSFGHERPVVTLDDAGDIYLALAFEDSVSIGAGAQQRTYHAEGGHDTLVAKLNTDGALVWSRHVAGEYNESIRVLEFGGDSLHALGTVAGERPFPPDHPTQRFAPGGMERFSTRYLARWGRDGELESYVLIDRDGDEEAETSPANPLHILPGPRGTRFWSGSISRTVVLEPDEETNYARKRRVGHRAIGQMTADGDPLWVHAFLSPDGWGGPLALDEQGALHFVSNFREPVEFGEEWGGIRFEHAGGPFSSQDFFVARITLPTALPAEKTPEQAE